MFWPVGIHPEDDLKRLILASVTTTTVKPDDCKHRALTLRFDKNGDDKIDQAPLAMQQCSYAALGIASNGISKSNPTGPKRRELRRKITSGLWCGVPARRPETRKTKVVLVTFESLFATLRPTPKVTFDWLTSFIFLGFGPSGWHATSQPQASNLNEGWRSATACGFCSVSWEVSYG